MYTDPSVVGKIRLVRNPASTLTTVVLDLVAAVDLTGYQVGFNLPLDTRIVGLWIALDEVTPANGCMYLLPGRHREGPKVHFKRRDWQICDDQLAGRRRVAAPMRAGDALLFDAKLPHGMPTNRTDQTRWAVQLHFVPRSVAETGDDARLAVFGSEGKNVTC